MLTRSHAARSWLHAAAIAVFAIHGAGHAQAAGRQGSGGAASEPTTVRIINDEKGYRFEPSDVRIPNGGAVRFVVASGGPHNVAFDQALAPDVAARLQANMPNTISALSGPFMFSPGDSYTVSFEGLPPGTYTFHCTPHLALGERGQIVVAPQGVSATVSNASAEKPLGSIALTGTSDFRGAIRSALTVLARQSPGQLLGQAGVPPSVGTFLRNMITAQEVYFVDSSRYVANFDELRRSLPSVMSTDLLPPSAQPLILTAGPGYWFAILPVNGGACAVAVNLPNPLTENMSDGAPACRLIDSQGAATSQASVPPSPATAPQNSGAPKDAFRADLERTARSALGYLGIEGIPGAGGIVRTGPLSWEYSTFSIDGCNLTVTGRIRVFTDNAPETTTWTVNLAKANADSIRVAIVNGASVLKPPMWKIEIVNTKYAIVERDEHGAVGSPDDLSLFGFSQEKLEAVAGDLRVLARACSM